MNIIIVDDQKSVLNGIERGVHFRDLGFENVFFASDALQAKEILCAQPIHIMLCDIEMPGEDGLVLNEWASKRFPDMIRILLTSHAEFSYAQESLRLGCFDYILQPAPFDEIETVLSRAILKHQDEAEKKKLYHNGALYESYKPELTDRIVMNLYSSNSENINQSISLLNRMGYPIKRQSYIQLLMISIYPYVDMTDPNYFDVSIRSIISNSIIDSGIKPPIYSLLTLNKYKRYVAMLFSNSDDLIEYSEQIYRDLFEKLKSNLDTDLALYVGNYSKFDKVREEVLLTENLISENVNETPGLFHIDQDNSHKKSINLAENMNRWRLMLSKNQFDNLTSNILSYIDFMVSVDRINFRGLCDLHQQITQLFFNYSYDNEIDIINLFTDDYSYNEFLDAFHNVESLKYAIIFITTALANSLHGDQNFLSDVKRAQTYILENVSKNITVKDVSEYVHRSPEYFTKVFKSKTGQNIKSYIMQVKLNVAKDLLANPNIPISLIAAEVGYSNFSHFTQIFKKYELITPTEYRKRILDISQP